MKKRPLTFKSLLLCIPLWIGLPLQAQWVISQVVSECRYGNYIVPIQVTHLAELPGEDVISIDRLFVRYGDYHLHSSKGKTTEGMPREVGFIAGGNKIFR